MLMKGKHIFDRPLTYRHLRLAEPPLEDLIGLLLQKLTDTKKRAALLKPPMREFFNDDLRHSERQPIFAIIENCRLLGEHLTRIEGVFDAKGKEYQTIIERQKSLKRAKKEKDSKDLSLSGINKRLEEEFGADD